jgi:hypothetical protein
MDNLDDCVGRLVLEDSVRRQLVFDDSVSVAVSYGEGLFLRAIERRQPEEEDRRRAAVLDDSVSVAVSYGEGLFLRAMEKAAERKQQEEEDRRRAAEWEELQMEVERKWGLFGYTTEDGYTTTDDRYVDIMKTWNGVEDGSSSEDDVGSWPKPTWRTRHLRPEDWCKMMAKEAKRGAKRLEAHRFQKHLQELDDNWQPQDIFAWLEFGEDDLPLEEWRKMRERQEREWESQSEMDF